MPQRRPNPYLYVARAVIVASGEYDAGWWGLFLDDVRVPDMLNAALDSGGYYEFRSTPLHEEHRDKPRVITELQCSAQMNGVFG